MLSFVSLVLLSTWHGREEEGKKGGLGAINYRCGIVSSMNGTEQVSSSL